MMKTFVRAAFVASLLGSAASAVALMTAPALAADAAPKSQAPALSKQVVIPLYAAQKAVEGGDFATAMTKIQEADALPDLTPEDKYQIAKFKGYVALNLKDEATALSAYEDVANSPVLEEADKPAAYSNIFVLANHAKKYDELIKYGEMLEAMKPQDDKTLAIISQAYYLTHDQANAAIWAQKSVDRAKANGTDADPFVLQLVLNEEAKTNQALALQTLEEIAASDPSPNSYQQLTGLALATPGIRDIDALFIYRLRFMAGGMQTSDDYTIMANIALQLGYPEEAKEVLEQGINAGKIAAGHGTAGGLLAQARTGADADERALPAIAASAAKSKSGEQDAKLAEDYWGYGRYADAEAAARRAIDKGGLKDPSEGNLILGVALVAQAKNVDAEKPLEMVDGSQARAKAAHLWDLFAKARAKQMGQDEAAETPTAPPAPAASGQTAPQQ